MKNDSCIDIEIVDNDIQHLKGIISGPKNTIYEGVSFTVDLIFTNDYPFEEPKAKFDTQIWHPLVDNDTGDLSDFMHSLDWTPALTLEKLLLELQVFLGNG